MSLASDYFTPIGRNQITARSILFPLSWIWLKQVIDDPTFDKPHPSFSFWRDWRRNAPPSLGARNGLNWNETKVEVLREKVL